MSRSIPSAVAAALLLLFAAPAAAEGPRGGMLRIDTDRDGFISRTEAETHTRAVFQRFDTDGDGILTWAEFRDPEENAPARGSPRARRHQSRQPWFAALDANGDGQVTQAEFMAVHMTAHDAADTNHDRKVSLTEYRRATHQATP